MILERLSAARASLLALVARIDAATALFESVWQHAGSLQLVAHGRSISRCPNCGAYMHDGTALPVSK